LTVVCDPLAQVLHLEALEAREWLLVALASLLPAVTGQLVKMAGRPKRIF
jgi:hypothetical protein